MLICFLAVVGMACNSASTNETKQAPSKEVNWVTLKEAQKMSAKDSKPLLLDVYTYWCGPCKMMDRMTFNDPKVAAAINEKFHPVKFNAESPDEVKIAGQTFSNPNYRADIPKNRRNSAHQLVRKLGVRGYPTLVVIDKDLNIKANLVGFKKPEQLLAELENL